MTIYVIVEAPKPYRRVVLDRLKKAGWVEPKSSKAHWMDHMLKYVFFELNGMRCGSCTEHSNIHQNADVHIGAKESEQVLRQYMEMGIEHRTRYCKVKFPV